MRFWTIQPRHVWRQMERGDSVRVDPQHPKYKGKRLWQYDWLSAALRRHRSGFDGGWPWWRSHGRRSTTGIAHCERQSPTATSGRYPSRGGQSLKRAGS